jgi:hypothetical protein
VTDTMRRYVMTRFREKGQELRERYGAMEDTAPLLWDLNLYLEKLLAQVEQAGSVSRSDGD